MRGEAGTQVHAEAQDWGGGVCHKVGVVARRPGALGGTADTLAKTRGWGNFLLRTYLTLLLNGHQDLSGSRPGWESLE